MFNVDDRFDGSEPVMLIPREQRVAAVGLWTLAGTWSKRFLKDGYVPGHMVDELGGSTELAEVLVAVRLWKRRRGGYQFVDWEKWQETREKVEQRRRDWRERQNRSRAKSAEIPGEPHDDVTRDSHASSPSPSPSPKPIDDRSPSGGGSRAETSPPDRSVHIGESVVDNSRPDPVRIAEHVATMTGRPASPLMAIGLAEHYLANAKRPPRMATRYVIACLNREEPAVVENYIDTGRWSA